MLSILTLVSVFLAIFGAGVFVAGATAMFRDFLADRKLKDLFGGLVFLALFGYVSATVASQIMFNFGRDLSELILVQKLLFASLTLSGVFLCAFLVERFQLKTRRSFFVLISLLAIFLLYRLTASDVNLVFREGIIEPVVLFSLAAPVKPLLALVWGAVAVFGLAAGRGRTDGRAVLAKYLGCSGIIFLAAMLSSFLYVRFGEAAFLVASWLLVLLAGTAFWLAEQIPEESEIALTPLKYFRTRLLFRLMFIFVLLIVVLFETTTLAFISISKSAMSQAILRNFSQRAETLANELTGLSGQPASVDLNRRLALESRPGSGVVFIVDRSGKLIAHPDEKRVLQGEIVSANGAAALVASGQTGSGEFRNELGELMVGAYQPVPRFGWGVVVEQPISQAYFEIRQLESNALLFVIIGLALTATVGVFFARSIERPIKELTLGTEAVARGDLHWRVEVNSQDEIGRLTTAFNQMTKELRDSQERLILSEKLASLGTMAAGMAHEIKNPLVSIRTFTQILQQKWEDKEFRDKFASIIPLEIERINRIAESLLKFGRPTRPELSRVDLNGLLDEVLLLFESQTKQFNIRVTKKLAELPEVSGDAGQIQQVLVNVVKNAIEAMPNGGELTIKSDLAAQLVRIEVADTGIGIPEENLKSLFDPFFTTKMTGTGMGLPISLRIVKEHHGTIDVRSEEGKGTTFIITLPLI